MLVIREEAPADHGRVREIQAAAFGRRNEADLVERLREAAHPYISLVAEKEEGIVGHVFFSPVEIESAPAPLGTLGLAPVAVDPAHQSVGVGSALVRTGLEACTQSGCRAVFLVGDPAYYARFGFVLAAPLGFSYGDPAIDPALQVAELSPGALSGLSGLVGFHRAFVETGCG